MHNVSSPESWEAMQPDLERQGAAGATHAKRADFGLGDGSSA